MKKKYQTLLLVCVLIISVLTTQISTVHSASANYGPPFGTEKELTGDLSPSGLSGTNTRDAITMWHDTRFKNMNTNVTSQYYVTQGYEIQKKLASDDFSGRSGYHLVPLNESLVKYYAGLANGNKDFVWNMVQSSPRYFYNNTTYIPFGQVVYYSGGGDPTMTHYPNAGITSPGFKSTYKTTNWPLIRTFEGREGGKSTTTLTSSSKLYIDASAYAVWNGGLIAEITVNNDPSTKFRLDSMAVTNYEAKLTKSYDISKVERFLKNGSNTIKLRISDPFGRSTEKTINVNYRSGEPTLKVIAKKEVCFDERVTVYAELTLPDGTKQQIGGSTFDKNANINWTFSNNPKTNYDDRFINITPTSIGNVTATAHYVNTAKKIDLKASTVIKFLDCENGENPDPDPDPEDPEGETPDNPCVGGGCDDTDLSCPPPNRPSDLNKPFEYKLDLITERIEGETVERGTQTHTPVTVFRADFSGERQAIKDRLNSAIADNNNRKATCQSNINTMESKLRSLQNQRDSIVSELSSCRSKPENDCSNLESGLLQINSAISRQQSSIDSAKNQLPIYDYINQEIREYLKDIADKERQFEVVNTEVELSFRSKVGSNNYVIERKPVSLQESERKVLNYYWILQEDGFVKAFIDPDDKYKETNEQNNMKETPIYIATFNMAACVPYGKTSKTEGIVRTITTETGTQNLKEYIEGKLVNQSRDSMRAGYGFSYEAEMKYRNEDPKSKAYGIQYTESYFDHLADHLPYDEGEHGYIVEMDATYDYATAPPRKHEQTWSLPEVMVEEKSGNVFEKDYHRNPNHNPSETMLDGGRKWYTPWLQKDGVYDYKVMGYEAGANKLGVCMDGQYEVFGTFIGDPDGNDDFVRRTFSPNNPFPSDVGWNWKGNVGLLTSLQPWWNEPPDRDPRTAPNSFDECYVLDRKAVKQVKAYNKRYGMEQDSFLPNGGRFWNEVGPFIEGCSRK